MQFYDLITYSFFLVLAISQVYGSDDHPVTKRYKCRRSSCCDQHEWCRFWASVGECKTNRHWMADNCKISCHTCIGSHHHHHHHSHHHHILSHSKGIPGKRPSSRHHHHNKAHVSKKHHHHHHHHAVSTHKKSKLFRKSKKVHETKKQRKTKTRVTSKPRKISPLARCRKIMANPSHAAEILIREKLIFPVEDTSGRRTLNFDDVVRSNIANACVPRLDEAECMRSLCFNLYYRTFDGTCNNLRHPLRGAAFRPYNRLLPPQYDDGLGEPVSSIRNHLPNARLVIRLVVSSKKIVATNEYNALLMQWGQFVTHDMLKTTLIPSSKCNVCRNIRSRCMVVPIRADDPNKVFKTGKCIRVSRSSPICGSGNRKPRQQLNENTNYLDASPIYGSSIKDHAKFREGRTGFLKMTKLNGMKVLPFDPAKCKDQKNKKTCKVVFLAGDSRVNLFFGLTSLHFVITKEHNRIAAKLKRMNPHWNGDRVFMEARKIIGAIAQAITYREYLPKILGSSFLSTVGEYRGYNPRVDSTLATEFNTAGFRFGHGMIQDIYPRLNSQFKNLSTFEFADATLKSENLIFKGGVDQVLRGMLATPLKRPQRLGGAITEKMFGNTDLGTINIERGRDHGLPPYVKYRQLCGLRRATSFDHFSREILSAKIRQKLKNVYGSPDKVDLFAGALLEDPVVRGLIGPTIACIIGPQLRRTRDGDRFYYENPGIFTRAQLKEIRKSSLARLICDNSAISRVPREAFRTGPITSCTKIPRMDLSKWKE